MKRSTLKEEKKKNRKRTNKLKKGGIKIKKKKQ
jgi:hypothetical protein